jgi:hypothetical protein
MAEQRWSERRGDRARRAGRLGRLGLALTLLLSAGCGGTPVEPVVVGAREPQPGISGERDSSTSLVGEWRAVLVFDVAADVQTQTIVWQFGTDRSCRRTITVSSVVEGIPRTTVRDCVFGTEGATLVITWADTGEPVRFAFGFAGFSPDRLVLDGIEYTRLA